MFDHKHRKAREFLLPVLVAGYLRKKSLAYMTSCRCAEIRCKTSGRNVDSIAFTVGITPNIRDIKRFQMIADRKFRCQKHCSLTVRVGNPVCHASKLHVLWCDFVSRYLAHHSQESVLVYSTWQSLLRYDIVSNSF